MSSSIDHPVLVPTSAGLVGAVVTEPTSTPRVAAVVFPGIRSTRAGSNGQWAHLARALAPHGVVTFRADFAGIGDSSHLPHGTRVADNAAEATAWFRERTADLDLLVIARCYGVGPALDLADHDPTVRAMALVTPPAPPTRAAAPGPSRARLAAHRVRRGPRRLAARLRDGRDPQGDYRMTSSLPAGVRMDQALRRVPTLVLAGELDDCAPLVETLRDAAADGPGSEVRIVPGLRLYRQTSAGAQTARLENVVEFLAAHVAERNALR